MCFTGVSPARGAQGAFAVAELPKHPLRESRTNSGLRVITITGERNELCEGRAINSWLQTSRGARSKNKRPSPATFSACSKVIRRQPLLCLHGAKIRQGHAGKWSRRCWGSETRSSGSPSLSPPSNAFWLPPSYLSPPLLSFSLSHPVLPAAAPLLHPLLCSCCFIGGWGRYFTHGVKRCHLHVFTGEVPRRSDESRDRQSSHTDVRCFPFCQGCNPNLQLF